MSSKSIITVNLPDSSTQCRGLSQFYLLRAVPRIRRLSVTGGIAAAVGTMLLSVVEVTHAADAVVPQIQIQTTVIDMPESIWNQMAGAGSWKVIPGQPAWKRLVVSMDRKEQDALVRAWFGDNVPGEPAEFLPAVFRAINQTKGVDILILPKVIRRTKQRSTIEMTREFKYATAWKPGAKEEDPWTPVAHATKSVGLTIAVEPAVLDSGNISLSVAPQFIEHEGDKDLGHGRLQPIFFESKVQTKVALQTGQTVILSVAGPEGEQRIEDKVPVLGDLPLLGRFFRTSSKTAFKNHRMVVVTPQIIPGK